MVFQLFYYKRFYYSKRNRKLFRQYSYTCVESEIIFQGLTEIICDYSSFADLLCQFSANVVFFCKHYLSLIVFYNPVGFFVSPVRCSVKEMLSNLSPESLKKLQGIYFVKRRFNFAILVFQNIFVLRPRLLTTSVLVSSIFVFSV